MVWLSKLKLSKRGVGFTVYGVVAISSQIPFITTLDLSWLINVTDISLNAIAINCLKLKKVILTECEGINGEGLHAFTNHKKLYYFVLFSCHNISWEYVESFALNSTEYRKIKLGRKPFALTPIQEEKLLCKSTWRCLFIGKCSIYWEWPKS